jgi:catechol 2,3-dioxygenase-like lactoylglutathione lyase family enzyme
MRSSLVIGVVSITEIALTISECHAIDWFAIRVASSIGESLGRRGNHSVRACRIRSISKSSTAGRRGADVDTWAKNIDAITLFVEDLAATKAFYVEVFGLPVHYEDANSAVFKFGDTLINLLDIAEAPALIEPAVVAPPDAGSRMQFTIGVDDVDAMCDTLKARGVELLNGPMDRPWGIRTASFRDPAGHIWEIAK